MLSMWNFNKSQIWNWIQASNNSVISEAINFLFPCFAKNFIVNRQDSILYIYGYYYATAHRLYRKY